MIKKKTPEIINLSTASLDELKSRVTAGSPLLAEDTRIILSVLSTYQWLQRQLQSTKFTIHRLKKLFGFSTEKRASLKNKMPPDDLPEQVEANGGLPAGNTTPNGDELPTKKS